MYLQKTLKLALKINFYFEITFKFVCVCMLWNSQRLFVVEKLILKVCFIRTNVVEAVVRLARVISKKL